MKEELLKLLKEELQNEKLKQTEDQMAIYQRELDDYGFTFDDKGNIENYKEVQCDECGRIQGSLT